MLTSGETSETGGGFRLELVKQFRSSRSQPLGAIGVILKLGVVAVLALLCRGGPGSGPEPVQPEVSPPVSSASARPSEGRLTGFSYSPYVPLPVVPSGPVAFEPGTRGGPAQASGTGETSPMDLRRRGILWLQDADGAERAVAMLERAVQLSPRDASLWSDLSAAYHARAERRGDPVDLLPAFRAARRAVDLDGDRPEARFNLALSYEKLFLPQARRAWGDYLKLDQDEPAWAREAADRFFRLASPSAASNWEAARTLLLEAADRGDLATVQDLAQRFSERARDLAEEDLLGKWAAQSLAGRPETAAATLNQVTRIASSLRALAEDRFLEEVVEAIENADSSRSEILARGHRAFQNGVDRQSVNVARAAQDFQAAAELLARGGSPFAHLAKLNLAICRYYLQEPGKAIEILSALEAELRDGFAKSLQGRTEWMLGLSRGVAGDASGALSAYQSALALFEQTGERERAGRAQLLTAELSWLLGDARGAWKAFHAALETALSVEDPGSRTATFFLAARDALMLGEPEAALAFQDAAVDVGRESKDPAALAHALLRRASVLAKLEQKGRAGPDIDEAERLIPAIAEAQARSRTAADLLSVRGELLLDVAPEKAAGFVTQALKQYGALGLGPVLSPLYLSRARARLASGQEDLAEKDLLAAVEAVERQRGRLREDSLRISYLDVSEAAYREIVQFYLERGEVARAFDYLERARSRTLLDQLEGSAHEPAPPLALREVQARLPDRVTLVEFSVDDQNARAWVLRRDQFRVIELPGAGRGLEGKVEAFRAAVQSSAPRTEIQRLSADLYRDLFQEALSGVPEDFLTVFVPEGPLHRLPFGALIDPASGRYLIEDRPLALAPSATLYVDALERESRRMGGGLLAVGDPAFDPEVHPLLLRLRWAEAEVSRLQPLYPEVRVLNGEEATKERFLALAGQFATVHYAGHALVHRESPALSSLLLAGKGPGAALYSEEIHRSWFPRTRLVVLASCNSADGWASRSEGLLSLARSFLAAGVPMVVAAAWPVNDEASIHLFTAFHRRLQAGESTPSALRSAQRELLRSRDPRLNSPANWAGVEVIGGARLQP